MDEPIRQPHATMADQARMPELIFQARHTDSIVYRRFSWTAPSQGDAVFFLGVRWVVDSVAHNYDTDTVLVTVGDPD